MIAALEIILLNLLEELKEQTCPLASERWNNKSELYTLSSQERSHGIVNSDILNIAYLKLHIYREDVLYYCTQSLLSR